MSDHTYSEEEWQSLHEEIQQRFRTLAVEIKSVSPRALIEYGKSGTKLFPLFSHMSFNETQAGDNDIIVGMSIIRVDGQWRIDADISEEEVGTIYLELPNAQFSVSCFDELCERVLSATDDLITRGKPLLLRLFGSPPPVMPSSAVGMPGVARKANV